jgi:hypothetical protein
VAWSRCCDTRKRKGETTGNTNFDLYRRASPRPLPYSLPPARPHARDRHTPLRKDEALTTVGRTKEKWWEAEINRVAGEIVLKLPEPKAVKAQAYFEHALSVARVQQAKSWELRAAMSMARLWRDQGKREEARDLLAPVYGWFTEGFDTRDLKEAKALLEERTA